MNRYILLLVLSIGFFSCNKNEDPAPAPKVQLSPEDQKKVDINNWIYETMKGIYYWTDEIPDSTDSLQAPEEFFDGLLSSSDRFSVIVPDYDELISALNGVTKEAGYEFLLARVQDSDDVVAIILYIKRGSPAAAAHLKRGDVITQINGTTITINNYQDLVPKVFENHSITYRRYNDQLAAYEDQGTIDLTAVVLAEDPNFMDSVYTVGSHKVGYFIYNFFSPGTKGSSTYDDEMDQIIGNFKDQGVTDLVLDLRYNSGGAVASAKNLASLIGTGVNSSKIFYKNQWNDLYQNYIESQANGDAILRARFLDKAENIGSQINGQVYILTGSRTASASELIINGLDPYMNVTIIGETTVGKNVGSLPIEDTENPDNPYGMLPIVFKIFNSEGFSEYEDGFTPLGENQVDDFQQPMKALGDVEEPLLARAMSLIEGTSMGGRKTQTSGKIVTPIMTSIDLKKRSNKLILDKAPR